MRELLLKVEYLERSSIGIGRVGEEDSTRIKIEFSYWKESFPNISFEAIYKRADGISYPVAILVEDNYIIWEIKRKDLYKAGTAYLTLIGYEYNNKVISSTGLCFIMPGIDGTVIDSKYQDNPTPIDWIQQVVDKIGLLEKDVDERINMTVQNYGFITTKTVDILPDINEATLNTIYLVKQDDNNDYIEYIVVLSNNEKRYEQIGDSLLNKKLIINCGAAI